MYARSAEATRAGTSLRAHLSPVGCVRSCGLPFSWLEELACPDIAEAIDAAADPRAAELAAEAADVATAALRDVAARPGLDLALASSNPALYERVLRPFVDGEGRRARKRARILTSYLQRFAAKNDTAAGFGPMDRVHFGGEASLSQPDCPASSGAERRGILAWWFVQALADRMIADPGIRRHVRPRLHSMVALSEDAVRMGGDALPLPAATLAALRELAAGRPVPSSRELEPLRRLGLLRSDILVPVGLPDTARWLESVAATWGEAGARWAGVIAELRGKAQELGTAPPGPRAALLSALERRASDILGKDVEGPRQEGRFYADRRVLYEEARGCPSGVYRVGGRLLERMEAQLEPLCWLSACYGYGRHLEARRALRRRLGADRASFEQTVDVARRHAADLRGEGEGPAAIRGMLAAALEDGQADPEAIWDIVEASPRPPLSFASPDVMLDHREGAEPDLVLGELHHHVQVLGILQLFWGDDDILDWVDQVTGGARQGFAQVVSPRRSGKVYFPEWGGWSIELEARAVRGRRVPFGGVEVHWRGDEPRVVMPGGESALLLPIDHEDPLSVALSPVLAALPPVGDGAFSPERRVGELLVQRPTWRLPGPRAHAGTVTQRFLSARRWRAAHGLPEQVFVRSANQPKPFYVDLRSPLLCDVFARWTEGQDTLSVSALVPAGAGLWLERAGERYCSELRTSFVMTEC